MADLSDTIESAAGKPLSATVDGLAVTGRSAADLIQADQYLASKAAAKKRLRGVAVTRLITPGAADDNGANAAGFNTQGGLY